MAASSLSSIGNGEFVGGKHQRSIWNGEFVSGNSIGSIGNGNLLGR